MRGGLEKDIEIEKEIEPFGAPTAKRFKASAIPRVGSTEKGGMYVYINLDINYMVQPAVKLPSQKGKELEGVYVYLT